MDSGFRRKDEKVAKGERVSSRGRPGRHLDRSGEIQPVAKDQRLFLRDGAPLARAGQAQDLPESPSP